MGMLYEYDDAEHAVIAGSSHGDSVVAGVCHQVEQYNAAAGATVPSADEALQEYAKVQAPHVHHLSEACQWWAETFPQHES